MGNGESSRRGHSKLKPGKLRVCFVYVVWRFSTSTSTSTSTYKQLPIALGWTWRAQLEKLTLSHVSLSLCLPPSDFWLPFPSRVQSSRVEPQCKLHQSPLTIFPWQAARSGKYKVFGQLWIGFKTTHSRHYTDCDRHFTPRLVPLFLPLSLLVQQIEKLEIQLSRKRISRVGEGGTSGTGGRRANVSGSRSSRLLSNWASSSAVCICVFLL